MKQLILLFLLCLSAKNLSAQEAIAPKYSKEVKDSLIARYWTNGAMKYSTYDAQYQFYSDSILTYLPNNPDIWHQKGIPLFKSGKYELGMKYLNRAVDLDRKEYIAYRGFIHCIFLKKHTASIEDFKEAQATKGEGYEIDHPYNYYIGLNYLQMNQLDSAKFYLNKALDFERLSKSEGFLSTTNWFYLAIIEYEQTHWETAANLFDKTLSYYEGFPEAKYYKALCMNKLGKKEQAKVLLKEAIAAYHCDYLFPEYNAVYEKYPYSITKRTMQGQLEYLEKGE
jgi:tetratricopeptide (TPR) repeat protein